MKTTRPIFPVLPVSFTTERLLIRSYLPSDAEDIFIIRSQPEVMRWTTSGVPDEDIGKTREWMTPALPPLTGDTFRLAIEERSNPGRVIGAVGNRLSDPPACWYMLRKEMWGKGYATEALKAWVDAFWLLPRKTVTFEGEEGPASAIESLVAETEPANARSKRVLVKRGFTELRTWEEDGCQLIQHIYRSPA